MAVRLELSVWNICSTFQATSFHSISQGACLVPLEVAALLVTVEAWEVTPLPTVVAAAERAGIRARVARALHISQSPPETGAVLVVIMRWVMEQLEVVVAVAGWGCMAWAPAELLAVWAAPWEATVAFVIR